MDIEVSQIETTLRSIETELNRFKARHGRIIDAQMEQAKNCDAASSCSECERCLENKIYQELVQLQKETDLRLNVLTDTRKKAPN